MRSALKWAATLLVWVGIVASVLVSHGQARKEPSREPDVVVKEDGFSGPSGAILNAAKGEPQITSDQAISIAVDAAIDRLGTATSEQAFLGGDSDNGGALIWVVAFTNACLPSGPFGYQGVSCDANHQTWDVFIDASTGDVNGQGTGG